MVNFLNTHQSKDMNQWIEALFYGFKSILSKKVEETDFRALRRFMEDADEIMKQSDDHDWHDMHQQVILILRTFNEIQQKSVYQLVPQLEIFVEDMYQKENSTFSRLNHISKIIQEGLDNTSIVDIRKNHYNQNL